jgi:GAF domain-containing protein
MFLQEQSEPLLVDDVDNSPLMNGEPRDILARVGAKSLAALPLAISGRWVGLVFIHWDQPRKFNDREQRLYATLARQAAVVVNNRPLLEQTRKRAAELQTVAQVSTAASSILDPQELLQTVVDLTRTSFNLYHVQVYRYDYDLDALQVAAGSGTAGSMLVSSGVLTALGENQSPVSRAVRGRQLIIMNDSLLDQGYIPNALLPLVRGRPLNGRIQRNV